MKKIKHLNDCESYIEKINELIDAVNKLSAQEPSEIKYYRCISKVGIEGQFSLGLIYKCIDGELTDEYLDKWRVDNGCFEEVKKPKMREDYWLFDGWGKVAYNYWDDDEFDNFRWKNGLIFNSKKSAERMLKIINDREI